MSDRGASRRWERAAILIALVTVGCRESDRPVPPDGGPADARDDGDLCCPADRVRCDGECTDVQTDPEHCGHCDCACRGNEDCFGGVCEQVGFGCSAPKKVCSSGERLPPEGVCAPRRAGGSCVDVQSDNHNCGDCRVVCEEAKGFTCVAGACVCAKDLIDCVGECVDTDTNGSHCGACGCECAPGSACLGGQCVIDCGSSALTQCTEQGCFKLPKDCDGSWCTVCVDTQTSDAHCGGCNNACSGGKLCVAGACECPASAPDDCGGTCADLQTDEQHCGSCGNDCVGGQSCVAGCCITGAGWVPSVVVECPDTSLACGASMQCAAVTTRQDGTTAWVTSDAGTTWTAEAQPGSSCTPSIAAGLLAVSCPPAMSVPCLVYVFVTSSYEPDPTDPCAWYGTSVSPAGTVTVSP